MQRNEQLADNTYLTGEDFILADLVSGFVVTTLPQPDGRPIHTTGSLSFSSSTRTSLFSE